MKNLKTEECYFCQNLLLDTGSLSENVCHAIVFNFIEVNLKLCELLNWSNLHKHLEKDGNGSQIV